MTNFVKEIRTVVEQAIKDCNVPVRPNFPINVVSSSTAFRPRKCVIEVVITEALVKDRLESFNHYLTGYLGRDVTEVNTTYWPPSGTGTGSVVIRVTET